MIDVLSIWQYMEIAALVILGAFLLGFGIVIVIAVVTIGTNLILHIWGWRLFE